jgi:predicted nucleotidyltransferase
VPEVESFLADDFCGLKEYPLDQEIKSKMMEPTKSTSEVQITIAEMVRRIVARFHPERIVLYGSHARGTAGPHSDVDLLVVMEPNGSKRRRAVEIHGLLAGMGVPKDVIVVTPEEFDAYRDAPGTVIRTAWQEGKILHDCAA